MFGSTVRRPCAVSCVFVLCSSNTLQILVVDVRYRRYGARQSKRIPYAKRYILSDLQQTIFDLLCVVMVVVEARRCRVWGGDIQHIQVYWEMCVYFIVNGSGTLWCCWRCLVRCIPLVFAAVDIGIVIMLSPDAMPPPHSPPRHRRQQQKAIVDSACF